MLFNLAISEYSEELMDEEIHWCDKHVKENTETLHYNAAYLQRLRTDEKYVWRYASYT